MEAWQRTGVREVPLTAALTDDLCQRDRGGRRRVEGWDRARERDRDRRIAVFAHESPDPLALCADDDGDALEEVHAPKNVVSVSVERVDPEIGFLEAVNRADQIRRLDQRQVFEGACCAFACNSGKRRCAVLSEHERVRPECARGAGNRPEVVRVLDAVENDHDRFLWQATGVPRVGIGHRQRIDFQYDALVRAVVRDAIQVASATLLEGNGRRGLQDCLNAARVLKQIQPVRPAPPRPQAFEYRLAAIDAFPFHARLRDGLLLLSFARVGFVLHGIELKYLDELLKAKIERVVVRYALIYTVRVVVA